MRLALPLLASLIAVRVVGSGERALVAGARQSGGSAVGPQLAIVCADCPEGASLVRVDRRMLRPVGRRRLQLGSHGGFPVFSPRRQSQRRPRARRKRPFMALLRWAPRALPREDR